MGSVDDKFNKGGYNMIIKALGCCARLNYSNRSICKTECPYDGKCLNYNEKINFLVDVFNLVNRQKAEIERLKNKISSKCGTCAYAKPTTFGKSKCYVECTNKEHIEKYCRFRKISLKRQRTTPACKNYKEMTESKSE